MSKRVYISADYSIYDGDRDVNDNTAENEIRPFTEVRIFGNEE